MRKRIIQLDHQTGEQLEGTLVYVGVKYPSLYGGDWFMASREANETLATDPDLTGRTFRVLHFLLSRLDYENWIQVAQTEIAAKLDLHKSNVS